MTDNLIGMIDVKKYGLVFICGSLGGSCRLLITQYLMPSSALPIGTIVVNLVGCFLFPLIVGAIAQRLRWSKTVMTAASTGFVGAFTTFSSFSFDIVTLLAHQAYGLVVVYAGLSIFGGLGALIAGLALSHYLIERQVMTQ